MAVLEDMLPLAECNCLRIVMVRTVSAVWRSQLVSDFHSQGIRQLCGEYIVAQSCPGRTGFSTQISDNTTHKSIA